MDKDSAAFVGMQASLPLQVRSVFELQAASVHFGQPARAVRALSEVSLRIQAGEHRKTP